MIYFLCPHCGVKLKVKEERAFVERPCPKCGGQVRAPGSSGSHATPAKAKPSSHQMKKPSGAKGVPAQARPTGASAGTDTAPPPVGDGYDGTAYPFLAPAQGPDELGRLEQYVIRKVLGVGAMGVVFQAEDPHLRRKVALKVMRPSLSNIEEYRRRFVREARLAAAIEHDNVVPIYEVASDGVVPYLAMKLLLGETLEARLNRCPNGLSPTDALRIARETAEGLEAAHERGLIHRDIKPANIWLESPRSRVKILDFGLARGTAEDGIFTQAGAVIGTPAYMSPEQAKAEDVDARCDLFSLGVVLYRATTGAMPFTGKDTLSTLAALTSETPREPHELNPSVPLAFSDLIMALLEKDKTLRPQTARDLVTALEGIEQGAIVAALSPHVAEDDVPLAQIANAVVAQPLPVASLRTVEATEAVQPSRMLTDKADPAVSDKGTRVLWLQSMTVSSLRKMLRTLGSMVGIRRSAAPSVKTEPVEAHS